MKPCRMFLILSLLLSALTSQAQTKFWLGGDVSMLDEHQRAGVIYKGADGTVTDPLDLFKQVGWNMLRVRLFVDPDNAPGRHHDQGVCQDLSYVVNLCQRLHRAGFEIMLDFHYSDTWADPAKQFMPQRWELCDIDQLEEAVYDYTGNCLRTLILAGVKPAAIQVGNEITFGMMWPVGRVEPENDKNWPALSLLLKAGVRACREVCPESQVIIHTEKAGWWPATRGYYDRLKRYGVDYDIIGLSYYPMWHGTIPNLGATLDSLAVRYPDKKVMIVETAWYYAYYGPPGKDEDFSHCEPATPEGQATFTHKLITELYKHKNVTGLFWWYPEENTYGRTLHGGHLNRGLFDHKTGCALPAFYETERFVHFISP